eukprot:2295208-Pyramimonas_sp.AAC.2
MSHGFSEASIGRGWRAHGCFGQTHGRGNPLPYLYCLFHAMCPGWHRMRRPQLWRSRNRRGKDEADDDDDEDTEGPRDGMS